MCVISKIPFTAAEESKNGSEFGFIFSYIIFYFDCSFDRNIFCKSSPLQSSQFRAEGEKNFTRKHPKVHRWSYHFEIVNLAQYPFFVWFLLKLLRMDSVDCTSCLSSWRCKPPWHQSHMNRPVCTDKQLSLG